MSFFGDAFEFEEFAFKDLFDQIGDDPWRLLVGSGSPVSTEFWNFLLDRDDEPMVNIFGGPMGSGWAGLGDSGGVYSRAEEAGVPTESANTMHNIAEMVSAFYAGSGISSAFGDGGQFAGVDFQNPNTYRQLGNLGANAGGSGGLPYTAGGIQETPEQKAQRQHLDELLKQAFRLSEEQSRRNRASSSSSSVGGWF